MPECVGPRGICPAQSCRGGHRRCTRAGSGPKLGPWGSARSSGHRDSVVTCGVPPGGTKAARPWVTSWGASMSCSLLMVRRIRAYRSERVGLMSCSSAGAQLTAASIVNLRQERPVRLPSPRRAAVRDCNLHALEPARPLRQRAVSAWLAKPSSFTQRAAGHDGRRPHRPRRPVFRRRGPFTVPRGSALVRPGAPGGLNLGSAAQRPMNT